MEPGFPLNKRSSPDVSATAISSGSTNIVIFQPKIVDEEKQIDGGERGDERN